MSRRMTLQERIATRIARKRGEDVFLPREFADLGGEDQVLRALRGLVRDGVLVRLGYASMVARPSRSFPANRSCKARMALPALHARR
jgi:hypothetical protein